MARKLKKYVLPTALCTLGISLAFGIPLYIEETKPVDSRYKYELIDENNYVEPVLEETEGLYPMKPFIEETVSKTKDYFNDLDDLNTQNNSLIYYEGTYMPNTGILYSNDESFEVINVLDGKVSNIKDDEILGKYIEIDHQNGYKTVYYSLKETNVTVGDTILKGDVIGSSGNNKLDDGTSFNLLFETYQDGKLLDPEDFYNINFLINN